jgi:hypothetical protein
MKYTQPFSISFNDWEKARVNSEHNYEVLKRIDQQQRDRGELLWRYFRRNVADGYAYYQIVRVTKKSAIVEVCRGICLDEWTDNMLGEVCELPIKIVRDLIEQKDNLEKLFGR